MMETLLEDYKRKLKIVNEMIEGLDVKDTSNPRYVRLITKAGCFRAFIVELERELNS